MLSILNSLSNLFLNGMMVGSDMSLLEQMTPPEDISTNGHLIDSLFMYTTVWNIFYFTLVCAGLIGFSYLYHHRRNPKAYYTHGNKPKQLLVTLIIGVGVFFSVDMYIATKSTHDLTTVFWKYPKGEDVMKVEVLAQQWMWNFRYHGPDGKFNSDDDYTSNHDLVVPMNKNIEFRVSSKDVIHSFFIPNARLKVDAIPGRITRMWVNFNKAGTYEIACAEMCGTHHYMMKAKLIVLPQNEYDVWAKKSSALAMQSLDEENMDNYWGWKWEESK